ncbi:ATP-binding protein [Chthonobacter rhizosphaerae]|uniref:ATP-binding protein n=1 Tax=Chthonobacter rhizosphaerae TaxID=2735553 RepID=UPI0015EECB07
MNFDPAALIETAEELYEEAPCGYLTATPDGRIVRVNQTFTDWTGYAPDSLLGKRVQDLLTQGGRIFYETQIAPLLDMQGFVNEIALEVRCADEQHLPVLFNAVRKLGVEGRPVSTRITLFNATDRRTYERELLLAQREAERVAGELKALNETLERRIADEVAERLKAEEMLRQAQKMEAVGRLTGGIAHDFNNLLTIIIMNLDTLQQRMPEEQPRLRRAVENALHGANRAAALVQKLLAFSRRQPLDPKPIDANQLVNGMAELLKRTLGEPVALETVLARGLWRTKADPNQLESAILNLAVNARDAMSSGGKLTVETANTRLEETYVDKLPEPVPAGQYVLIAVSDTGTGMDQTTVNRVFEPFFTTKEAGKGTGLGLSQVYGFVRQSNGHVKIYSEVDHGTTVKIYLPRLIDDAAPSYEAAPQESATPRGEGELIVVVEDEHQLRAQSVEALAELGYRVVEAADGPSGLALIEQHPDVALLFTDVVLGGSMSGRALAEAATKRRPGLRVLYTTGYTANAIVHHGRLDPGVNLIGKPFSASDLGRRVRQTLTD